MGLKESLEQIDAQKRFSVRREVKKVLTQITKERRTQKKCSNCSNYQAAYTIKGLNEGYCKACAKELFGDLGHLQRTSDSQHKK